jgi:hypothetical protein
VHKVCLLTVESADVGIKAESLWTVCNIINCGSISSVKDFYDATTQEVVAYEHSDEDAEMNYREEGSSELVNSMIKGLIKGTKTMQDARLVANILEAFGKLFEVNQVYYESFYSIDSILGQFIQLQGMAALEACQQRFAAHDLTN